MYINAVDDEIRVKDCTIINSFGYYCENTIRTLITTNDTWENIKIEININILKKIGQNRIKKRASADVKAKITSPTLTTPPSSSIPAVNVLTLILTVFSLF